MNKKKIVILTLAAGCIAGVFIFRACSNSGIDPKLIFANHTPLAENEVKTIYPRDGSVFPREIPAPSFTWSDGNPAVNAWVIGIKTSVETNLVYGPVYKKQWQPSKQDWERIKQSFKPGPFRLSLQISFLGIDLEVPDKVISNGQVDIIISDDPVKDSLFFREVNLPFLEAVKDPSRETRPV